jgi:polyhydroxyalkanoate depolymerase
MLHTPLGDALAPYGLRPVTAGFDMMARAGITHTRPAFGITSVTVDDVDVPVVEEIADATPFATLLHFKKALTTETPPVLIVAPMSGHFSTLLRGTVRTMLLDHDVYLTDWHNARDVSVTAGRFGSDEYVDHLIRFLEHIGPGAHIVAVCQPCVPVLAAVAVMAEGGNPAQPRSMTLMAGPVDARINPTAVNNLAAEHSIAWFEQLISTVPARYRGADRRVYPGFLQLTAFVSMNAERHVRAHWDLYEDLITGHDVKAANIAAFYDEYFAVADLPAEFFLETVKTVFQTYDLARGEMTWHGQRVNPSAIERTALLTVEGERDDVCGIGQTMAAHDLCSGIRPYRKRHHLQAGVGHYGVFSGNRWTRQVYPVLHNVILAAS